jgi:hypothetical protein
MSKLMREFGFVAAAAILMIVPILVYGQGSQGKIVGSVKDPDGANVSGAEVSLLNPHQAVIRATVTDASGNFTLDNIAPGNYEIKVAPSGFAPYRTAVQVKAGGTKELSVMLGVNPLSEEVTVTAEAGQVSDARNVDTPVNVINEREILQRAPEVVAQLMKRQASTCSVRVHPSARFLCADLLVETSPCMLTAFGTRRVHSVAASARSSV